VVGVVTTMPLLWVLGEKTVGESDARLRHQTAGGATGGHPGGADGDALVRPSGCWGLGAIVAPLSMGQFNMGVMLGLKGFAAAILGGMGNPLGAVLGGVLLGALESTSAVVLPSGYKDAVAFALLLVVLLTRPQGLLGRRTRVV
jgi:branched-chain amino acid transport system permease protein